jgi:hypothetical protein
MAAPSKSDVVPICLGCWLEQKTAQKACAAKEYPEYIGHFLLEFFY